MKLVWLIALTIACVSFSSRLTTIEKALDIERQPLSASWTPSGRALTQKRWNDTPGHVAMRHKRIVACS